VVISVSDTGPGIPPELQERIFYPFFTTKQDGSGVGLSNVQKIVTGHGGAVVVESRPGEGATFRIHLPGTLEST
jgi:signal transduction histidine kinase